MYVYLSLLANVQTNFTCKNSVICILILMPQTHCTVSLQYFLQLNIYWTTVDKDWLGIYPFFFRVFMCACIKFHQNFIEKCWGHWEVGAGKSKGANFRINNLSLENCFTWNLILLLEQRSLIEISRRLTGANIDIYGQKFINIIKS